MTLDTLINELWSIRETRRELSQQDKALNERFTLLKQELLNQLDEQGVSGAKTPRARIVITEREVVRTTDWNTFCAYVRDHDAFHLLQKSPAVNACKELATIEGTPPPGLELLTLRDISITTV